MNLQLINKIKIILNCHDDNCFIQHKLIKNTGPDNFHKDIKKYKDIRSKEKFNNSLEWDNYYLGVRIFNSEFMTPPIALKHLPDIIHWDLLSSNKNTKMEFVKNNLHLPWDLPYLFLNPNINEEIVKKFYPQMCGIKCLVECENLSLKFLESIDFNFWKQSYLYNRTDIDLKFIKKKFLYSRKKLKSIIDKFPRIKFCPNHQLYFDYKNCMEYEKIFHIISMNENINIYDIIENVELFWDYELLSKRKDFTIDLVLLNLEKDLDWDRLSVNINIKDIEKNRQLPWNFIELAKNPTLTITFILSNNNLFTSEDQWKHISAEGNISMNDIENNKCLPWNYYYLSSSKQLTFDFIINNRNKNWCYKKISANKFEYELKTLAANIIKQAWFRYWRHPNRYMSKLNF